ncbi:MAG: TonB-dependent receptor [Bacteroidetes bacterium]|nr:TonB-dependent receptor [Bacteroidota bacterium]MBU1116265.1 TonB-dependent receptor [Bacteroidota bacterium]MBU1799763.1 TonB-dependent receptor [Bacteroidota bacterium]
MKKLFTLLLIITLNSLFAQDSLKYKLDDIVVTSLHRPALLFDVNRSMEIIPLQKIESSPINCVHDFLSYSNSVELSQRGANGVQADLGIRGGNFEQTLIMLDGIKIIDPQTGHHNLNLPITLLNIEQIEIVKGNSSNINGANAFSGLVNFRTKRNKFNSISAFAESGDFGLYSGSLFGSFNLGNLSNNISIEKNHSNGYQENTEYDITNLSYGASYTTSKSIIDIFIGYNDKSYGANSFYTTAFPLQFEHTKTALVKASAEFGNDDLNYSTKFYWRNNEDEFLLNKTNPSFYKNNHTTNIYGVEADLFLKSEIGETSFGGEFVYDKIESNNLGNHNRNRMGIFVEQKLPEFNNFYLGISGFAYNYSTIGWKLWPGIELGYSAAKNLNLFANFSRGFRIPTYTELFYKSPTIIGNSNLSFEETTNYEIGAKYFNSNFTLSTSLFYKSGTNIIDYVQVSTKLPWSAMNIAELNTAGIELNFNLNLSELLKQQLINNIDIKYTYLNSDYTQDKFTSRYLLKYLKHHGIVSINHNLVWDIETNWYFRYEDRYNSESNFITDLSINKSFNNFNVFIKATNLFNVDYFDFIGITLPGRWIAGGVKFSLSK